MNPVTLDLLLAHPAVQALGHGLLQFLWQGLFLALLLLAARRITSSARIRYATATAIMLAMPIALVVTTVANRHGEPARVAATRSVTPQAFSTEATQLVYDAAPAGQLRAGISGWAAGVWAVGVLLLSLRATGGWATAQRLKRGINPAGARLEETLERLKRKLGVSAPVRLCTSVRVRVPCAIGWLRPWIFLPVSALTGLDEWQVEAILAHELAHIRRQDYLIGLLQTAVETVLFYHPAVWWVGRQMRIEREHCCDDIAVAACGNAFQYASALAEMEEIRDRVPEPALAASGGELLGRIRRLLGDNSEVSRASGASVAMTLVLIVSATAVLSLRAAPQDASPAFDVASIKRDVSGQPGPMFRLFPGFHVERATVKDLVVLAYLVHDFQVTGGPGWITSDRYNIEAKAEAVPAFNQQVRTLQLRRLQELLQDRFKLAVHRETRELPTYDLIVAKGGLKLQPLKEGSCIATEPGKPFPAPGKNPMDYCGFGGITGRGRFESSSTTMTDMAGSLSLLTGRQVFDKTGIKGLYRVQLTFAPDSSAFPFSPETPGATGNPTPAADSGPNLFTAVQEQLGLKLESSRGPVEVLVIDHVEKPSEN